ncbi:MAG: hypothetical protein HY716_00905 [Planctomycetes bacterium]|nr:hypothetical protein [Planctomycetota bacterium]
MAALIAAAALTAAGCSRQGDAHVLFKGATPRTSAVKDTRTFEFQCPVCKMSIEPDTPRCPDRNCGAIITWPQSVTCSYCSGSGVCPACWWMGQSDGDCYNCQGRGVILPAVGSRPCPNCNGGQKCPICGGTRKCDSCEGTRRLDMSKLKERFAKRKGGGADPESRKEEAPPQENPE